ncbi:hypothetical protein ACVXHB_22595 [Escherichia coli]
MRVSSLRGEDIDVAAESLKVAEAFRIHTFIATSPMHIATKLRSTLDEVIERAIYMVKRARNYTDDVEFSCEDAGVHQLPIRREWSKRRLMPVPPPSTFRTPWATPCRLSSPESSAACMNAYLTSTKPLSSVHTHDDFRPGSRQRTGGGTCRCTPGGRCNERDRRACRKLFLEEVIMAIKFVRIFSTSTPPLIARRYGAPAS